MSKRKAAQARAAELTNGNGVAGSAPVQEETGLGEIRIHFVRREPLDIEVDVDVLTWDEFSELEDLMNGDVKDVSSSDRMIDLIQKCVLNQELRKLPMRAMMEVIKTVTTSIQGVLGTERKN